MYGVCRPVELEKVNVVFMYYGSLEDKTLKQHLVSNLRERRSLRQAKHLDLSTFTYLINCLTVLYSAKAPVESTVFMNAPGYPHGGCAGSIPLDW